MQNGLQQAVRQGQTVFKCLVFPVALPVYLYITRVKTDNVANQIVENTSLERYQCHRQQYGAADAGHGYQGPVLVAPQVAPGECEQHGYLIFVMFSTLKNDSSTGLSKMSDL